MQAITWSDATNDEWGKLQFGSTGDTLSEILEGYIIIEMYTTSFTTVVNASRPGVDVREASHIDFVHEKRHMEVGG